MKDQHFDKYFIGFFLLVMTGVCVYFAIHGTEKGFDWATHVYDNFQGALLGLITGIAVGMKIGSKPPDPPSPPKESSASINI